jgi:hypothetical protein
MWSHPPVLKQKADRLRANHVRSSEVTDSIKREKRQKHLIRPSEVHDGYTESEFAAAYKQSLDSEPSGANLRCVAVSNRPNLRVPILQFQVELKR